MLTTPARLHGAIAGPGGARRQARHGLDELVGLAQGALAEGRVADGLAITAQIGSSLERAPLAARQQAAHLRLHVLFRAGALTAFLEEAVDLLPVLRVGGADAQLFDVLRWLAEASGEAGRLTAALATSQECHQLAQSVGRKDWLALSLNVQAHCQERAGDPWQAERLMVEALTLAREHNAARELQVVLLNACALRLGQFQLLRDAVSLEQARVPLEAALPLVEEASALAGGPLDAFSRVGVAAVKAEVLVHLGRRAEAQACLAEALPVAQARGYEALNWRLSLALGEWQLEAGQARQAWSTLNALMQQLARAEARSLQAKTAQALWRTARVLGRPDDALRHLEAFLHFERDRTIQRLQSQSLLFMPRHEGERAHREAHRQRQRATELEADTRRDPLTGVGNRRLVDHRLPGLIEHSRCSGQPLAAVMLDIDHFKQVNDRFGHTVGDQVLVVIGERLRQLTRSEDLVARLGGEEFLVVLNGLPPGDALDVCSRLQQQVAGHDWAALAPGLHVTVSIGLAGTPEHEAANLIDAADRALYRAKAAGRDHIVLG